MVYLGAFECIRNEIPSNQIPSTRGKAMDDLTAKQVEGAKPKAKPYKLADGGGLYLLVTKAGKYWRFNYRIMGKQKTLALKTFPDVTLKDVRKEHKKAREQVQNGIDPSQLKQIQKEARFAAAENSFRKLAEEWLTKQVNWTEGHRRTVLQRLKNDVFPFLGDRPVAELQPPDILKVCRKVESRGAIESAHRIKTVISQVFRYGVAIGLVQSDPCRDLLGALTPVKAEHLASFNDPKKIGELLRAIDAYEGHPIVRAALQLSPLVFVRPGELRNAEWSEFDFEKGEWKIDALKMKGRVTHIVPLSRQAVQILEELRPITGGGKYVFPSLRSSSRPMSNNAVNAALRRMGYSKEELTGHGFRSMASTRLHEMQWPSHLVELQLAHKEGNKVKAAYNYAEHLPRRREMMQAWADYLDGLRASSSNNVVAFGKAG
jgi:integrase